MKNTITSAYTAIVDGKFTGLAGCANSDLCQLASNCLRADQQLAMRVPHECAGLPRYFISRQISVQPNRPESSDADSAVTPIKVVSC